MIARPASFLAGSVADAVGGTLLGDGARRFSGLGTDTRDPLKEALFVALCGARFDAHDFLGQALQAGATGLLVSDKGWSKAGLAATDLSVIVVQDTLRALGDLANAHRRRQAVPVFAITGSNGKTTAKEMAASILGAAQPCLKTQGNLNNLIGLPLTLLGLQDEHRSAVVEMGMNQPGEIARYTEIAEPDAGLVLNVGPAHIGRLGSLEAIAAAKGELFAGLGGAAMAVVNLDDARVVQQAESVPAARRRTFGRSLGAEVRLVQERGLPEGGQQITLEVLGERLQARLPLEGAHNALNAAGAVALVGARPDLFSVSMDHMRAGLEATTVPGGRFALQRLGTVWVVDDCYNANRASMEAALQTASAMAKAKGVRLVALLGEMRELGDFSNDEHAAVGARAAQLGISAVAAFGPMAAPMAEAAAAGGIAAHHEAEDELALFQWAKAHWQANDVILLKGSRGIQMERFIAHIAGED